MTVVEWQWENMLRFFSIRGELFIAICSSACFIYFLSFCAVCFGFLDFCKNLRRFCIIGSVGRVFRIWSTDVLSC